MSWNALLELLAAEVGQDAALRFERRARMELGGVRVTVGVRPVQCQCGGLAATI